MRVHMVHTAAALPDLNRHHSASKPLAQLLTRLLPVTDSDIAGCSSTRCAPLYYVMPLRADWLLRHCWLQLSGIAAATIRGQDRRSWPVGCTE